MSDDSKTALCAVLCNEIQIYKELIRGAINLNDDDMEQSIEELRRTCPSEAIEETCLRERPDFHKRIFNAFGASADSASLEPLKTSKLGPT